MANVELSGRGHRMQDSTANYRINDNSSQISNERVSVTLILFLPFDYTYNVCLIGTDE